MVFIIIIILIVGFFMYYVWNLPFEEGTGFTEMRGKIKDVEYDVVDKEIENAKLENKNK